MIELVIQCIKLSIYGINLCLGLPFNKIFEFKNFGKLTYAAWWMAFIILSLIKCNWAVKIVTACANDWRHKLAGRTF